MVKKTTKKTENVKTTKEEKKSTKGKDAIIDDKLNVAGDKQKTTNEEKAHVEEDLKDDIKKIKVAEVKDSKDDDTNAEKHPKKEKASNAEETDEEKNDGSLDILKYILIGGGIILFLFIAFLIFQSQQNAQKTDEYAVYNEFEFKKQDMLWLTEAQIGSTLFELPFRYHPKDLEDIPINGSYDFLDKYSYAYVTFDPNLHNKYVTLSYTEVIFPLKFNFDKIPKAGVIVDEQKYMDAGASYVTCQNTTEPVIFLNNVDVPPSIVIEGNCITVNGKDENLLRASDRLIYRMFGIMKE